MFCFLKVLLKIFYRNLKFIKGPKNKQEEYKVIYVMKKGDSPAYIGNTKYAMFISWKKTGKRMIIVGQNPSRSNNDFELDKTNKNIISVLKGLNYSGYVMINTYSKIDSKGSLITNISNDSKNVKISRFLIRFFKTKIIACSTSNNICYEFYDKNLSKLQFKACFTNSNIIKHFSYFGLIRFGGINKVKNVEIKEVSITIKNSNQQCNTCKVHIKEK